MVVYEEIYNSSNHKHITYHYALFDHEIKFGVLDLITCLWENLWLSLPISHRQVLTQLSL
jgi:hypothetical protein